MVSDHRRRLLKTTVGVGRRSFHFLPLPSFLLSRTLPLSRPLFSPFPPYPCGTPLRSRQEIWGNAVAPSGSGRSKAAKYFLVYFELKMALRDIYVEQWQSVGDCPPPQTFDCEAIVPRVWSLLLKHHWNCQCKKDWFNRNIKLKQCWNIIVMSVAIKGTRHSNGQQISLVWTIRKTTNIICTKNAKCFYEKADFAGNIAAKKLWMRLVYNHKLASNLHSAVVYIIKHISTKQVK